ncbi:YdeI/OmpD-associated family protein [uncultured Acetobacteroides sp.]|uniref:YdeI/OmpD-associated family protein n=1 Tax=uncultured Acetobacteroides sp. TaxID=1760811 RepID=UPI0029F5C73A|nr:YdeI/OmpD-associated family protein [uncultured Acetobacteroides sp.]
MMEKGNHTDGVPEELQKLLDNDSQAQEFFNSLANSYKKGYCDWVGSAKQAATRQTRAEKAILMLRNNQKTLKTL